MSIMDKKIKTIDFVDGMILTTTTDGKIYSRPIDVFPLLSRASDEERRAYTIGKFGDDVRTHFRRRLKWHRNTSITIILFIN